MNATLKKIMTVLVTSLLILAMGQAAWADKYVIVNGYDDHGWHKGHKHKHWKHHHDCDEHTTVVHHYAPAPYYAPAPVYAPAPRPGVAVGGSIWVGGWQVLR